MRKQKKSGSWLIIVFVITAGIIFLCDFPAREPGTEQSRIVLEETAAPDGQETGAEGDQSAGQEDGIYVYVCGSVVSPGVYQLSFGARVFQAIEAAGGPAEDADTDGMNLAQTVSDGDRVYVPAAGADQDAEAAGGISLININRASAEELTDLPGIGKSKANAIINYRLQNGSFSSKEDLLLVPGIKEGIYRQIEALITVR